MISMRRVRLTGCAPDVAIMYLKAIGAFRAVAVQTGGDGSARAAWEGDTFVIESALDDKEVTDFFLHRYIPTPIVSPWNVSCGFYTNDGPPYKILQKTTERLAPYKRTINDVFCILNDVFDSSPFPCEATDGDDFDDPKKYTVPEKEVVKDTLKKNKVKIMEMSRNRLPDMVLPWIDAAAVMKPRGGWSAGPILGTGGVDGKIEFSSTYMKYVLECVGGDHKNLGQMHDLIHNSLYGNNASLKGVKRVAGHLHPGSYSTFATGPPSKSQDTMLNPWDYVLAMEGIMFFAGAISRRGEAGYAAFPFSVNTSWAGHDTACDHENGEGAGSDRGEVWLPLWDRMATCGEIEYVFDEGMVQSHKRPTTGAGMAVALANYGAMRGIRAFERYGIFKRKGDAHHMISIGRIRTGGQHDGGKVLQEIEPWLESIRAKGRQLAAGGGKLPASIESLLRTVDDAVIRYCKSQSAPGLQHILVMLGRLERQLALSPRLKLQPLNRLSPEWLAACNTGTAEFRLAAALASIHEKGYPIRCNLERVEVPDNPSKQVKWISDNPVTTVWGVGSLTRNLIAVLERRCMSRNGRGRLVRDTSDDAEEAGTVHEPHRAIVPLGSRAYAAVSDVVAFAEGRIDDGQIYDLLLPLSAIEYRADAIKKLHYSASFSIPDHVPEAYAVLKANMPPIPPANATSADPVFESSLIGLLKAGNVTAAVDAAKRRLRISGYRIPAFNDADNYLSRDNVSRLCASLIFPVKQGDVIRMIRSREA